MDVMKEIAAVCNLFFMFILKDVSVSKLGLDEGVIVVFIRNSL